MKQPEPATPEAEVLLRAAERDYKTFSILKDNPEAPLGSTCFHAQQYVEKIMKAVLVTYGNVFRPTHDLEKLAGMFDDLGIEMPLPRYRILKLNPFAVTVRYDDMEIETVTLAEAGATVEAIRLWAHELVEFKE